MVISDCPILNAYVIVKAIILARWVFQIENEECPRRGDTFPHFSKRYSVALRVEYYLNCFVRRLELYIKIPPSQLN